MRLLRPDLLPAALAILFLLLPAPSASDAAPAVPPAKQIRDPGQAVAAPPTPSAPVAWRPFGPEAMRSARAAGRPILLFVTTPWCHLCRVMDETAFADPDVRRLVAEGFLPARLDGERRPDLNERYNLGGWPTAIFLVDDGEPLLYPREDARPADAAPDGTGAIAIAKVGSTFLSTGELKALLLATGRYFRENRPSLRTLSAKIAAVRAEEERRPIPDLVAPDAAAAEAASSKIAGALRADFDPKFGGFGDPPEFSEKFPFPEGIAFALARASRGDARFRSIVEATIAGLTRGALRDPLAGGFHRFSASRDWSEPHMEKLLAVNATILDTLSQTSAAGIARGDAAPAAAETLAWMRRTLAIPGSPLLASAQDSGTTRRGAAFEEGVAYTWTRAEIEAALAPMTPGDRAMVMAHFGFGSAPAGEGASVRRPPRLTADVRTIATRMKTRPDAVEAALEKGTSLLRAAAAARKQPEVFRTPYTDANAQAVSAFLAAAGALGKPDADGAAIAILSTLWRERWVEGTGLRHEAGAGGVPAGGLLRDHLAMLAACLDAYEATGNSAWLDRAEAIAGIMEKRFLDARHGTYLDIAPRSPGPDVPSPLTRGRAVLAENAVAALALTRLAVHRDALAHRARAGTLLAWCLTQTEAYGRHAAEVGIALERIRQPPLAILLWAGPGTPARKAMLLAARGVYDPGRVILPLDPARDAAALGRFGAAVPPDPSVLVCRPRGASAPEKTPTGCAAPIRPGGDLAVAIRGAAATLAP